MTYAHSPAGGATHLKLLAFDLNRHRSRHAEHALRFARLVFDDAEIEWRLTHVLGETSSRAGSKVSGLFDLWDDEIPRANHHQTQPVTDGSNGCVRGMAGASG